MHPIGSYPVSRAHLYSSFHDLTHTERYSQTAAILIPTIFSLMSRAWPMGKVVLFAS
uniref:Uncharacterized protein n=1 Tax=Rhizophora mucronata TaxID=61149 RepID=A0A2P2NX49_RHIMU